MDPCPKTSAYTDSREAFLYRLLFLALALSAYHLGMLIFRFIERASKSRTHVTYLTLFVCAAVVIGVLAGVVYSFLGGELTIRFILKSLTAAGIAAGIFGHYLRDMRVEPTQTVR